MATRVLIVDDSALVRKVLGDLLSQDPGIEVVGAASDGAYAMRYVRDLKPDVITLDIEMRQVGGLEFLQQLMAENPIPAIMVSAHTAKGAEVTLKALSAGAVDFVTKPQAGVTEGMTAIAKELAAKIKQCSSAKVSRRPTRTSPGPAPARTSRPPVAAARPVVSSSDGLIVIGASTGGTEALSVVLRELPANSPPVLVVQHMPETFTLAFANRLDQICRIRVKEAADRDPVQGGQALIAPGNYHMELKRAASGYMVNVHQGERVNRHRPSVDVLFHSVASLAPRRTVAAILTGMGADGARGMLELRRRGVQTVAQNEESCVVFGMPKEAIALGGVDAVVPLGEVASTLVSMLNGRGRAKATA